MKLVLAKTLWVFLFFTLIIAEFSVCIGICKESEQQALETLKKEVHDPDNELSSWIVGKACCGWEGVLCHNVTHHVTELQIYADYVSVNLKINNLEWLSSLVNLENLQMSNVDLSKATNWLQVTNMLPSLVELSLNDCSLQHISPILDPLNFSTLETLLLSGNNFSSPIPKWIFFLPDLVTLDLADNNFIGPFPKAPVSCLQIGCLSKLEYFNIINNRLEGIVTENHFTNLTQLRYFYANGNNMTLKVSQNWIPPFQVERISISGWNVGPQFPMWLHTQKKIVYLDISNCGIVGEAPAWFWNLSSQLNYFNISRNQFIGEVQNISASFIDFSSNSFSGPLPQISISTIELDLSNNAFSGGLSHLLCEAKNESYELCFLNLGGNDLYEEIPDCWMNWPHLGALFLKENNLIGGLPRSMGTLSHLKYLDLSKNSLTCPLPSSLGNCTKLRILNLDENEFVGNIPSWLGMRLSNLILLSLRSNNFQSELPQELCNLDDLQVLNLDNNNFFGVIPRCIGNFTAMVTGRNLEDRHFDLSYLYILSNNTEYGMHVGNSAMLTTKGHMYMYDSILGQVRSLDMSCNNLSGDIPISLTRLVGLGSCNFSNNRLTGRIPNSIGDMKLLESFDLSKNRLSGQIPQSLSRLSFLAYLNISYNNLSGKIPLSTQLQSFNSSSFEGNKKLCGPPLLVNCTSDDPIPNKDEPEEESIEDDEWDEFYIAMAIGFVLCFWGISATLIFKRSWRHAYYRFLDNTWNSLRVKLRI